MIQYTHPDCYNRHTDFLGIALGSGTTKVVMDVVDNAEEYEAALHDAFVTSLTVTLNSFHDIR